MIPMKPADMARSYDHDFNAQIAYCFHRDRVAYELKEFYKFTASFHHSNHRFPWSARNGVLHEHHQNTHDLHPDTIAEDETVEFSILEDETEHGTIQSSGNNDSFEWEFQRPFSSASASSIELVSPSSIRERLTAEVKSRPFSPIMDSNIGIGANTSIVHHGSNKNETGISPRKSIANNCRPFSRDDTRRHSSEAWSRPQSRLQYSRIDETGSFLPNNNPLSQSYPSYPYEYNYNLHDGHENGNGNSYNQVGGNGCIHDHADDYDGHGHEHEHEHEHEHNTLYINSTNMLATRQQMLLSSPSSHLRPGSAFFFARSLYRRRHFDHERKKESRMKEFGDDSSGLSYLPGDMQMHTKMNMNMKNPIANIDANAYANVATDTAAYAYPGDAQSVMSIGSTTSMLELRRKKRILEESLSRSKTFANRYDREYADPRRKKFEAEHHDLEYEHGISDTTLDSFPTMLMKLNVNAT